MAVPIWTLYHVDEGLGQADSLQTTSRLLTDARVEQSNVSAVASGHSRLTSGRRGECLSLRVLYAEVDPHGHRLYEG